MGNSSWAISNPERRCCQSAALNMPTHLENSAVAKGLEKFSFIPTPKKGNAKECSIYHTIALISHANNVMLKILQARVQQYVNQELPDVQAGFRQGRFFTNWAMREALCVDHNKLWKMKILKEMGIPDHLTCLLWNLYAGQEATERQNQTWINRLIPSRESRMSRPCIVTLLI